MSMPRLVKPGGQLFAVQNPLPARLEVTAAPVTTVARRGYAQVGTGTDESHLASFPKELMRRPGCSAARLGADMGVRHPLMYRSLDGMDVPSTNSCRKIAEFRRVPLMNILAYSGHAPDAREAPPDSWPAFGDCLCGKYSNTLREGVITVVEGLIEARRHRAEHPQRHRPFQMCAGAGCR